MKKQYIKMNDNDKYLSLGNLFRLIKENSKNRTSALQSEIFCTLFNVESINDTTVNNYCVGCRGIGNEFKQSFISLEKKYDSDKSVFCDIIIGLLNIMDGSIHVINNDKISFINNNENAINLCKKLYYIAKNDRFVSNDLINLLSDGIKNNQIYDCLVRELIYIVLYNRQPLYEEELKKEVLDTILNDTSISSTSLEEYLSLKLREGINYDYSLRELASRDNAYANAEMGTNEYYGYFAGYPRYDVAYNYLIKASNLNHAGASYMIGNMYVKGFIGTRSKEDLEKGYNFLVKAYELGNVAACNTIGNMYFEGVYPLSKDIDKAMEYYTIACKSNYAYSFNNIGKIYELKKDYNKAFENYLIAADLGESWACNKVGEFYRLGIISKDLSKAFYYYNRALESNYRVLCYIAYYNLAKYFYLNGCEGITLKDKNKAISMLEIAYKNGCFNALLLLFYITVNDYKVNKKKSIYDKLISYKKLIEKDSKYNDDIRVEIENKIKLIQDSKEINIDCLV